MFTGPINLQILRQSGLIPVEFILKMLVTRNVCVRASSHKIAITHFLLNFTTSENVIGTHFRYMSEKIDSHGTTVNTEEVEKFQIKSDEWWDKKGMFSALHSMNSLRVPIIRDGILSEMINRDKNQSKPLKNINILDVGCGGGILSEPLARLGAFVTGLDPGIENINVAKCHVQQDNEIRDSLNYICCTVEDLSKLEKKYDAVVCSEVIEHVDNVEQFLRCCVELTKDNGSIFFTTINKTFISYWAAIVAAENILQVLPKKTHEWKKFVKPSDLKSILESHGCRTKLIHGMGYNPITGNWFWSRCNHVSYALHAIKDKL